jgi:hypothetical protein
MSARIPDIERLLAAAHEALEALSRAALILEARGTPAGFCHHAALQLEQAIKQLERRP